MKSIRYVVLSSLLTLGVFGAVLYSSCNKDQCSGVTCANGGTCSGGNCTCPTGWSGTNCLTARFIGTWAGTDTYTGFSSGSVNYNLTISLSSTSSNTVLISNMGAYGSSNIINGTLSTDGKTITFNNQIVNASSTPDTLTGTITLTDSTHFSDNYTAREASGSLSNSGMFTKQ
jgi:hypothetical protein